MWIAVSSSISYAGYSMFLFSQSCVFKFRSVGMAHIDDLWARFSITEEEEQGANVPKQVEPCLFRLAAKFFMKRVVNAKAVARTFKPLWKLCAELKIHGIGGNLLLFEFDDTIDLERVLEFEPWTYDKSLVVFQRAVDAKSTPLLAFNSIYFWVQLHNVLTTSLTPETGEAVGSSIGTIVQLAELEDDGVGRGCITH